MKKTLDEKLKSAVKAILENEKYSSIFGPVKDFLVLFDENPEERLAMIELIATSWNSEHAYVKKFIEDEYLSVSGWNIELLMSWEKYIKIKERWFRGVGSSVSDFSKWVFNLISREDLIGDGRAIVFAVILFCMCPYVIEPETLSSSE